MKKLIISLLLVSGLYATSERECNVYENKLLHYVKVTQSNPSSQKKYSMLMVKSYLDSIILECSHIDNYEEYKKMVPKIKQMWKYNVPSQIRNQSQNRWKY